MNGEVYNIDHYSEGHANLIAFSSLLSSFYFYKGVGCGVRFFGLGTTEPEKKGRPFQPFQALVVIEMVEMDVVLGGAPTSRALIVSFKGIWCPLHCMDG